MSDPLVSSDGKSITTEQSVQSKPGFGNYLSSFFTGWVTKDIIEDEIRYATNREKLPVVSFRNIFTKKGMGELGQAFGDRTVWKELGKEAGIHGASIIPGAVLGYVCLKPVTTLVRSVFTPKPHETPAPVATADPAAPVATVESAAHDGTVEAKAVTTATQR